MCLKSSLSLLPLGFQTEFKVLILHLNPHGSVLAVKSGSVEVGLTS